MTTPPARLSIPSVGLLGRHQLAAAAATVVDFGAMIALVELARLRPPVATFLSAMLGALVNFTVSRSWAYRELHGGSLRSQALRYAVVSLGGAALNGLLLALALGLTRGYVAFRLGVSFLVSVLYTFPLHTRYVFRIGRASAEASR